LPLQGGLPPADPVAGTVVEIACDESGFSGTKSNGDTNPTAGPWSGSSKHETRCYETGSARPPRMSSTG
jgi:hypothetical protein